MFKFGAPVATDATYTVKRIDDDFFESIQFEPARFIVSSTLFFILALWAFLTIRQQIAVHDGAGIGENRDWPGTPS